VYGRRTPRRRGEASGYALMYTNDEKGNTLAVKAAGSVTTMTWSYEDEMLTVQPSTGGRVTMTYDGDHLRRKRQNGSGTTRYLWDDQQVLLETNGNGVTQARYTLAPFGYGDLVSMRRASTTSFYHFDAIGSTRALTDGDEAVTDTYLYDAFGSLLASAGSTGNPYRYVGRLGYQQETGLTGYYLRRRYYQPGAGRLVTPSRAAVGLAGYAARAMGMSASSLDLGLDTGCTAEQEAQLYRAIHEACRVFSEDDKMACAVDNCCESGESLTCARDWCATPNFRCAEPGRDKDCDEGGVCAHTLGYKDDKPGVPVPVGDHLVVWCQRSFVPGSGCASDKVLRDNVLHELTHTCIGMGEKGAKQKTRCLVNCFKAGVTPPRPSSGVWRP